MLYPKSKTPELDMELFKKPTCEYRGAPFWAWNDNLDKDELLWQIDALHDMGFGGFHMHTRAGMATPYLSDEFMELIAACVNHAKDKKMLAWLYDEDRWPSGASGGIVTKNKLYRQKYMVLTQEARSEVLDAKRFSGYIGRIGTATPNPTVNDAAVYKEGKPYLLAVFDISLTPDGKLDDYSVIGPFDAAKGEKWYAYVYCERERGWYNGQTYLDVFSKEAVQEFLRVTHDTYYAKVGNEFGKTVHSIFTDEPNFREVDRAKYANSKNSRITGWGNDMPVVFAERYGYDLIDHLPEIFWDVKDGVSKARYHFHDLTAQLFADAFSKQYGDWCREHGINMTGHYLEEPTLNSQSAHIGEAMRHYGYMGLPGVDMLCDWIELNTAKQTASCVHQYGKEGMTSELYGVTGWDFDFRGHKFQGDWQAALGVTVRVPHLSWYSMKGSAKRDYPASINYQSAWYREYGYVEDHFARVNTVLTRGTPSVKVGVIHPIETYWLYYGPNDTNSAKTVQMEKLFADLPEWLLKGQIDFDYISEASVPQLYHGAQNGVMKFGQMQYEAIVVPALETLRSTTLRALEEFAQAGGKVVFMGGMPQYIDAEPSDAAAALYAKATVVSVTANDLLRALEGQRDLSLRRTDGVLSDEYVYQKRVDGRYDWVFIARIVKKAGRGLSTLPPVTPDSLKVQYRGHKKPVIFDTVSGETRAVPYAFEGNTTIFNVSLYASDSLLVRFEDAAECCAAQPAQDAVKPNRVIDYKDKVAYARTEQNVLVLDLAEWSEDGKSYHPTEEMLRIDNLLRAEYQFPEATGNDIQPWLLAGETIEHFPYLRFTVNSEIDVACDLAFEELESVTLNGVNVPVTKDAYFTDKRIYKMPLGIIKKGSNTIVAKVPFGKRLSLENMFLLGDFDVRVEGIVCTIAKKSDTISFGSIAQQGLPFYGAELTYDLPFECGACDAVVHAPWYKGALISAELDGKPVGKIVYAPYNLKLENVTPGKHLLRLTLYVTRVNTFGGLHNACDPLWKGPNLWFPGDEEFSYEYQLRDNGILKSPTISFFDK